MAVYMSILFFLLMSQMAVLLVLSLPLPTILRNCISKLYNNYLSKSSQVKTALIVLNCIVLSLFLDSYKRANLQLPKREHGLPVQPDLIVTKAYHQRNVYISGFILYYMICIPFMIRLISKVAKLNSTSMTLKSDEDEMIIALKSKLDSKIKSLEVLEKQYKNKKQFVDEQKFGNITEDLSVKKDK
ncbi:hypothetical protein QEN19_000899 [Hanseniaspora menglaensis]